MRHGQYSFTEIFFKFSHLLYICDFKKKCKVDVFYFLKSFLAGIKNSDEKVVRTISDCATHPVIHGNVMAPYVTPTCALLQGKGDACGTSDKWLILTRFCMMTTNYLTRKLKTRS